MMMNTSDSEGLGLSVLLYLGAIVGALALLAVPAYYATRVGSDFLAFGLSSATVSASTKV
jgi:sorbitol-specific phosphotransferase system component IIBC